MSRKVISGIKQKVYLVFKNEINAKVVTNLNEENFILSLNLEKKEVNKAGYDVLIDEPRHCFEFQLKKKELYLLKNEGTGVLLGVFKPISKASSVQMFERVIIFG